MLIEEALQILASPLAGRTFKDKASLVPFSWEWFVKAELSKVGLELRPKSSKDIVVKRGFAEYKCRRGTDDIAVILSPSENIGLKYALNNIRGGIFVDIGAHIGLYSIAAGKYLSKTGEVIAIEPEPTNFEMLQKNIKLNNLTNVKALEVGIGDSDGTGILSVPYGISTAWASSRPLYTQSRHSELSIKIFQLDHLIPYSQFGDVCMVKIDVERGEGKVSKGMEGILRKGSPRLLVEWLPKEFDLYLGGLGYQIRRLSGRALVVERGSK